ncbi:E3 ubiquitin-protein ligase TRIM33-like [Morone saxatilis]|uniref:E3 ubiquitin-protein ligase TRIM33-like n=1 Tax=Morone saxatilis TaxID=34816 RepID=UPI0015E20EAA|nr:E3 ubiquitin-protein ligase TRIM33-like [Morone saxatilis]
MEPPPSPESPVTLVMVSCSACGSANASIICSACGRGFHRDCHVPPVGPHMWSEWICSLCQDLSDPSDPYSSDRPQRPQSPCLGLQDQRRCESLLLYLKVEGCSRLSESGFVWSQLTLSSERLTLHRRPSYQTAAEFLSDIWILLRDAEVRYNNNNNIMLCSSISD